MENKKILIIDDDIGILDLITDLLDDFENVDLATRPDGQSALTLLQKEHFDLIISDNHMPNMTGLELKDHLNMMGVTTNFIIMSGNTDLNLSSLSALGLKHLIIKPFKIRELKDIIKESLS